MTLALVTGNDMARSAEHPSLGGEETGKVPNARKPKVRPPRGWRDKVITPGRALPTYTGPYAVATMEIEIPVEDPRAFSHIKRNGHHLLQLETVLMTIYYPASVDHYNLQKHDGRFSRELWLGRPRAEIAAGYGRFAGIGNLALPLFLPAMFTKLPAYRNAPIADHWAPQMNIRDRGKKVKLESGTAPQGAGSQPVFPVNTLSKTRSACAYDMSNV